MKLSLKLFIGLCFSPLVTTSNVEFLDDLLPQAYRGAFEISAAEAQFDKGLDILGYMDNLKGSKPKEAEISDYSISYKFHNGLRISTEKNSSFAEATRPVIPKSISTETESDLYFISYPFLNRSKFLWVNNYYFSIFITVPYIMIFNLVWFESK